MLQECIKQYDLPDKETLEKEHGTLSFDENDDILFELVTSLRTKVSKYTSFIEQLLQPESDMIQLLEADQFSEKDRDWLYKVFTSLEAKIRSFKLVYLSPTPDSLATYYKELFSLWQNKKDEMRQIVSKALDAWNSTEPEQSESYLG